MRLFFVSSLVLAVVWNTAFAQTTRRNPHSITAAEKREQQMNFLKLGLPENDNVQAGVLTREILLQLAAQPKADGIRCFFGLDADVRLHLIFTAASGKENIYSLIASPFRSESGVIISEAAAREMTERYVKSSLFGVYKQHGGTMPLDAVQELLKLNTQAVRFYFGIDSAGKMSVIWTPIVPIQQPRNGIIRGSVSQMTGESDALLLDRMGLCPPNCFDIPF